MELLQQTLNNSGILFDNLNLMPYNMRMKPYIMIAFIAFTCLVYAEIRILNARNDKGVREAWKPNPKLVIEGKTLDEAWRQVYFEAGGDD